MKPALRILAKAILAVRGGEIINVYKDVIA